MQNEIRKTEQVLPLFTGRANTNEPQPFDPDYTLCKVTYPLCELLNTLAHRNEAVFSKTDKYTTVCGIPVASKAFYLNTNETPEVTFFMNGWEYLVVYEILRSKHNEKGATNVN